MHLSRIKILSILCFSLFFSSSSYLSAQDCYTIYLIRHAEKAVSLENPRDPELSDCGTLRANSLAHFFSEIEIENIYSTDFKRTRSTAQPTALQKELSPELYNPENLELFADKLITDRQNSLVVGHSNTTIELARQLSGTDIQPLAMSEGVYDRIYQVIFCGDKTQLNIFQSAFSCEN